METILYAVRHGATAANLERPPKLQGCGQDPPLSEEGVAEAAAVRDWLADRPLAAVYTSPLLRAAQTAAAIARPRGLQPVVVDVLTECDVGRWEGRDWASIRRDEPDAYAAHHADPAVNGYP